MAMELETQIMREIGLGQHYSWFNGSGSCRGIRDNAIAQLSVKCKAHGLTVSPAWMAYCQEASRVDNINGNVYSLTNVWVACSDAIADAIHRSQGGEGYSPPHNPEWHFFSDKDRQQYRQQMSFHEMKGFRS